jgi:serine/threonine protein kinase
VNDWSGQQLGNYLLTHRLGIGGFAEVYLGEHVFLGIPAAIKVLHQEHMLAEEQKAFAQEARTVAKLIHPHIVRLLDFGFQEEIPFLVMDYASGGTLRKVYPRGTQLPLEMVIEYAHQIAEALQFAHDRHLIHRDIKPENLLLGSNHEVLVGDFGIALAVQSSRAHSTQEVIGTAQYMAPEQILGKPHLASDQYALGIVVYEWLTGATPFRGSFTEICAQHMHAPLPPLRTHRPDLHPEVEQTLGRALAKRPEERFTTVSEFVKAFSESGQETMMHRLLPSVASTPPAKPFIVSSATSLSVAELEAVVQTPKPVTTETAAPFAQAYKIFCQQLEESASPGRFSGTLVIPLPEDQVNEVVYLQEKYWWQENIKKFLQSAQVQRYTVQDYSLTAAIFKNIHPKVYVVWTNQQPPVQIILSAGKVMLLDFAQAKKVIR